MLQVIGSETRLSQHEEQRRETWKELQRLLQRDVRRSESIPELKIFRKGRSDPMPVNPKSLKNLRPAQKGEIRNPTGVHRRKPVSHRYFELSEEVMPAKLVYRFNRKWKERLLHVGDSYARGAAMGIMLEAIFGGEAVRAVKEIREAIEGKAPQRITVAPDKAQVTVRVLYDRTPERQRDFDGS